MRRFLGAIALVALVAGGLFAAPGPALLLDPVDSAALEEHRGSPVAIRTLGGGSFRGTLFYIGEDRLELADATGRIIGIARSAVLAIELLDPSRDRAEYFQDSASNRLVVMPTGFGMEEGEFHIAAQEIAFITASYGISPHFSLWGGVSIPGGVVNLRWSTLLGEGTALSVGALLGGAWMEAAGLVLPYALASLGHPNRNFSFGAGLPFGWTLAEGFRPVGLVGSLGGKLIVSSSASIVTENWVILVSDRWAWDELLAYLLPAVVFRIAGERLSWDIGAVLPLILSGDGGLLLEGLADGTVIPIPILSVTYRID